MKNLYKWLIYISILVFLTYVLKTIQNLKKIDKEKKEIEEYVEKEKADQQIQVKLVKEGRIIALDVNDYIRGVLPAEMPPDYEMEALKAQAIVARTYLYNKMKEKNHADADICDNYNHCQAFYTEDKIIEIWKNKGFTETQIKEYLNKINKAVNETTGYCIKYNGDFIKAFFHANSGGKTEDSKEIWGGEAIPYLKSVESKGEESHKYYKTDEKYNISEIENIIYNNLGIKEKNIDILDYTVSGRVRNVKIGTRTLNATTLRSMFGLKSTNFTIEKKENEYIFHVTGYGHGVGMSQTGANYYAKQGQKAEEIIKHYYTGVNIEKI